MSERSEKAASIVNNHSYLAGGLGFIPVPGLDVAGVGGAQVSMLYKLCKLYDVPFAKESVRTAIGSLIGGSLPLVVSSSAVGSALKAIPFLGTALGIVTVPALSFAVTVALGRVFINHFETGGTLLDFDVEKMRTHFVAEFEKAKGKVEAADDAGAKDSAETAAAGFSASVSQVPVH
ncbi:MAG: hypothetical protein WCO00_04735 [Rhodospirillaceae bacterium]